MRDWATDNARLRLDRDAVNDAHRRDAEGLTVVKPASGDCGCTAGATCQRNAACPRRRVHKRAAR